MRILSSRLVNYCLKGSVVSLYSRQSRSWCSWEGDPGEIADKTPPKRVNGTEAVEKEMREMRREMGMAMAKLQEASKSNEDLITKLKEDMKSDTEAVLTIATWALVIYLVFGDKAAVGFSILFLFIFIVTN
ncbi:PREDICTED: uncharacterized protein LOC104810091 [Tarenaya hassleriana]|uniref:uncharacterized protein LOC104810091 n=1 Tax=Tarenaya hassleriana TaxID=28532 RepID=UPI00053C26AC|nr:PREDICTED: uncharacterized protein LOC104810091 [Tarenaya hassleriana]